MPDWYSINKRTLKLASYSEEYTCPPGIHTDAFTAREALLSVLPSVTGPGWLLSDVDVSSDPESTAGQSDVWRGTATWTPNGQTPAKKQEQQTPKVGEWVIDFQTAGGNAHIVAALGGEAGQTVYPASERNNVAYHGLIGVTKDGVTGCDIIVPQTQFTARSTFYNYALGSRFLRTCTDLTGTVNASKCFGYDPGELLFAGLSGSMRYRFDDDTETTELGYTFLATKNVTNWPYAGGAITVASKEGHQHVWLYTVQEVEDGKVKTFKPKTAAVATVYAKQSWSALKVPRG